MTLGSPAGQRERAARDAGADLELRTLLERAMGAMERAYAPYSSFHVGAALLGSDGSITEACNVENAAFPSGTCAERAALAGAVARGVRTFRSIAIATSADEPTPPCGMCRQALIEFSPELEIISVTRGGKEARWRLADLLPHAFSPRSLERSTD
ncbi:MAG TPA: cytidine deaminase [Gemmatimonadaceae bacterium]|nr:cytidine deaminase [Gemmatimonadaceae bacterium]